MTKKEILNTIAVTLISTALGCWLGFWYDNILIGLITGIAFLGFSIMKLAEGA